MTPLRVPLALKILMAIGLLFALNELAPGLAQAVLLLVALYLVLTNQTKIRALLVGTTDSFGRALQGARYPSQTSGH